MGLLLAGCGLCLVQVVGAVAVYIHLGRVSAKWLKKQQQEQPKKPGTS